jgi:hypothetical protein
MKKTLKLWWQAKGPDMIAALILSCCLCLGYYGATLAAIELIFHSADPKVQTLGGLIVIGEILVGFKMTTT